MSTKLTVIGQQPPAVPTRAFNEFKDLIRTLDDLLRIYEQFEHCSEAISDSTRDIKNNPLSFNRAKALNAVQMTKNCLKSYFEEKKTQQILDKARTTFEFYDNEQMYDDDGIKRKIVAEKVSDMLGAFPNLGPHDPQRYIPRMVDEIKAALPFAAALEETTRRIVREKTFPPTVAEVLKILREEDERWEGRISMIDTTQYEDFTVGIKKIEARMHELEATLKTT
jgi:hypothetical protein